MSAEAQSRPEAVEAESQRLALTFCDNFGGKILKSAAATYRI